MGSLVLLLIFMTKCLFLFNLIKCIYFNKTLLKWFVGKKPVISIMSIPSWYYFNFFFFKLGVWGTCRYQKSEEKCQKLAPSPVWVLRTKLKSSGFTTGNFNHLAVLLAPPPGIKLYIMFCGFSYFPLTFLTELL